MRCNRLIAIIVMALALSLVGCASDAPPRTEEEAAAALYREAKGAMRAGNYENAVEKLETLQTRYPFGAYAEQAQLDIIQAYQEMGEPSSAIAAAERFVRLNPRHPAVPYAHYMRGVTHMTKGQSTLSDWFDLDRARRDPTPLERGFEAFRTVVTEYPDSQYAEDAQARMREIRSLLAQHEIHVAEFYMDRGAYVAAVNRAKGVIKNYQNTDMVDPALGIMARAYGKLEIPQLREDILRVIRANDPDHPLLEELSGVNGAASAG